MALTDTQKNNHEKNEEVESMVFSIIVEGTPHEWSERKISYSEVVTLFDPQYLQHPEITYSVTYKNGPPKKPEGILVPGAFVKVCNGVQFNVSATGQS